ncbi:MAG: glycine cleavage system protein GcvH [Candidatus Omnitrophica bacterium]|nr:glycine cleavage system protein GcvH [Candidatus Omnitrophota bacterium]
MNFPGDLRYTKTHEWIRREGEKWIVGISDYAQHEISDVVFVELPHVSQQVEGGKAACIVESVKAAFDIYAPVSGTIKAINTTLESDPGLVNQEPYGKGWFFELTPANPKDWDSLLARDQYEQMIKQGAAE